MILEHYVSLWKKNGDDFSKYSSQVWDILQNSYKNIGGIAGVDSPEQLVAKSDLWKMVRRSGKITAVQVYRTDVGGRKAVAGGSDGTEQGKQDLFKIMLEDFTRDDREVFSEMSGKALGSALKRGATPVLASTVKDFMSKYGRDIEPLPDGYFYRRHIGSKDYIKVLLGKLPGQQRTPGSPELIKKIKELSIKYSKLE